LGGRTGTTVHLARGWRSGEVESVRGRTWIAIGLVVACLAVFGQVRDQEFVSLDDYKYVVQNPDLRDGLTLRGLSKTLQPRFLNWIPLTSLSYQVDYALYGLEPSGYHLTNLLLHTMSAVLLFLVFARMTGEVWRSGFVAAVFAIHPLHVESVAWVSERKDVLSGLFMMLTLYGYVHYRELPSSWSRYLATIACFALGLLAKSMLVTLPFVLLLLDHWPLERFSGRADRTAEWRRALIEKIPFLALAAGASAVTFAVQGAGGAIHDFERLPLGLRVANAVDSYARYLLDAVWPLELGVFYPHPLGSISALEVGAAVVVLAILTFASLRFARTHPYLPVGWFWYLGMLVPVIGLVQVGDQARADRYMYLPLIGLSLPIAWGVPALAARWGIPRAAVTASACAVLVALGAVARDQVGTWRNTEALFRRALSVTVDNHRAHQALGNALLQQERIDEAAAQFREAARLSPAWPNPRVGLADVEVQKGRIDVALRIYEAVLDLEPNDSAARGRYGLALGLVGRFAEAKVHLERSLADHRGTAELYRALAEIEAALGNVRAAQAHGREALLMQPGDTEAANNLAWLLATTADPALRNPGEAIRLVEANAQGSEAPWLLDTLAAAYAADGRFEQAIRTADRAARIATEQEQTASAQEIRERLAQYRKHEPYLEPGPASR
jgi:tetratricopeptide (TPR) repeat protein